MPGSFTVSGLSAGELAGERVFGPLTMVGKAVIGETLVVPMVNGDNTFAVPLESVAVMIIPPVGAILKLRTSLNASDAGLPLVEANYPTVYPFPSNIPTSLILHSTGTTSSGVSITFI